MHTTRIAFIIAVTLIVSTVFCSENFGQDKDQALIESAKQGDLKQVQELLKKGTDINAKDEGGQTALMWASFNGNAEIVKVLLDRGTDIDAKNTHGLTALLLASGGGHPEIVKVLLDRGADVDAKDTQGGTALMFASGMGHAEVVKVLLAKRADINTKDNEGRTALLSASSKGHAEVVKVLLAQGADIDARDKNGSTALIRASLNGHAEAVKDLLDQGADINAKETHGATALMCASCTGHAEAVKVLLAKRADIDAKDTHGATPLMCASLKGHAEVVKVLLAKGANINAKDNEGNPPLISASFRGHAEVVKVLLAKGADINAKAEDGSTALKLASLDHPEVVNLLKAHGARETGESKSVSDELLMPAGTEMWGIAVLLLIAFVLIVFAKIAKTRRMLSVFLWLAVAVGIVAMYLVYLMGYDASAIVGFLFLFQPIADLIARPILRRRIIPPCVRVRRTPIYKTVQFFFCIAFGILFVTETFRAPRMMLFPGLMTATIIISLILYLSERVEVCGNGVWQYGGLQWLQPWEIYESFFWKAKTKDGVELWVVPKSWIYPRARLLVSPEDCEAVQHILEANLPDRSTDSEAYSRWPFL